VFAVPSPVDGREGNSGGLVMLAVTAKELEVRDS
jgi:hypothetical protein